MKAPIISGHTGRPYDRRTTFGVEELKVQLTFAQEKALAELTHDWRPASSMSARLSTLNALVVRGLAERRYNHIMGIRPRNSTLYKLSGDDK